MDELKVVDSAAWQVHFADTIIPDPSNPADFLTASSYVHNNASIFIDPSGHMFCDSDGPLCRIKTFTDARLMPSAEKSFTFTSNSTSSSDPFVGLNNQTQVMYHVTN